MANRPLTDHEYKINSGPWIQCTSSNTTDNGDGTYTIHDGLNISIPTGQLQVRVRILGVNPPSTSLLSNAPFTVSAPKKIQLFIVGDSITSGIGTSTSGSSASGNYYGSTSYPAKTISKLSALNINGYFRGFPGEAVDWWNPNDLTTTISMFDHSYYSDVYVCLFFGANDLVEVDEVTFETNLQAVCAPLKAAGAKVIIMPVLSRKDSIAAGIGYANIARRNAFNSWLTTHYTSFSDAIVDLSGHPEIFGDNAPDDPTYFAAPDADGSSKVHPTDAACEIIATQLAATVTALSLTPSVPVTPVDHAAVFIAAAGITDSAQITAINGLVNGLITNNLWSRFAAIYPFVGTGANNQKYNLKDPRDLDAAYRLVFSGTPTFNTAGVTWLSNSYADSKFVTIDFQQTIYENLSLHYYSRTPGALGVDMGSNSGHTCWLGINDGGSSFTGINSGGSGHPETYVETGLFSICRHAYDHQTYYKNGAIIRDESLLVNGYLQGYTFWIGAANHSLVNTWPSPRNCGYAAIGWGLTSAEEATHYSIVQAFQIALGREV